MPFHSGLYANDESAQRRVSEVEEKGVLGTRVEIASRVRERTIIL